jgi:hypothetical protein
LACPYLNALAVAKQKEGGTHDLDFSAKLRCLEDEPTACVVPLRQMLNTNDGGATPVWATLRENCSFSNAAQNDVSTARFAFQIAGR